MLAHLRTEAYPVYRRHAYPPAFVASAPSGASYERNIALIDLAKQELEDRTLAGSGATVDAIDSSPPR